jgi:ankyrin repeat protein
MEPCKVCEEPTDFFCALCGGFYFCKKHACRHSSPEQFASKAADSAAASVSGTQQLTFGGVKWETAYGWLFAVAGAYLLVAGLATFFAGEKAASIGLSVGNAKPIGIAAALIQGLLFGSTGLAIIQRHKIAIALIWATVIFSGVGVFLRGLSPLDILLWLASLGLAIGYSNKKRLAPNPDVTRVGNEPTHSGVTSAKGNRKVVAILAGCGGLIALLVVGLAVFNSSSTSPEHAREQLARLNFQYDSKTFIKAAANGDILAVRLFLNAGINPGDALPAAAAKGHTEIVHLLLDKGADPNKRIDNSGQTPLMEAIMLGETEAVRVLLDMGGDVNSKAPAGTACGSPLMYAADHSNSHITRLLLDRGANPNATENGDTPLFCAIVMGRAENVMVLLEHGAVPGERDLRLAKKLAIMGGDNLETFKFVRAATAKR